MAWWAAPAAAQWAEAPKPKAPWAEATPRPLATAAPLKVGTLALARYHGGGYHWSAMIQEIRGNLVTVQYSGGDKESLPATLVAPLTWRRGTSIECKAGTTGYVPMTIIAIDARSWAVETVGNDGKARKTSLRFCRSKARTA